MSSPPVSGHMLQTSLQSPSWSMQTRTKRPSSEHQLEELEPRSDYALSPEVEAKTHQHRPAMSDKQRASSWDAWSIKTPSSTRSHTESRRKPMFQRPPPPIAASIIKGSDLNSRSPTRSSSARRQGIASTTASESQSGIHFLEHSQKESYIPYDSVWRALMRREQALEQDIQRFLDMQAIGLIAGSEQLGSNEEGDYSETRSSTPTDTFYSTATSRSRMLKSLHMPRRSTPDGNLLPVRQPRTSKTASLRSARKGLRHTMAAMTRLKQEEDAHVDDALSQRRRAIAQLGKLYERHQKVTEELRMFEEDEEEPLGRSLRQLEDQYDTVSQEIKQLEEKLVAMRNHRRYLRDQVEDVKSRREAGLSGYRGALKDAESDLTALMQHPTVRPLDKELVQRHNPSNIANDSTGGAEFLSLIPERRTPEMARAWWEEEIEILEQRKCRINTEERALEEGRLVWEEVSMVVGSFESQLRALMKAGTTSISIKGKEKALSPEDLVREHFPEMKKVLANLQSHMAYVEDQNWNLLICAIGAELEAFREAYEVVEGLMDIPATETREHEKPDHQNAEEVEQHTGLGESDNEVPLDLIVSHIDDNLSREVPQRSLTPKLDKAEGDNEVPSEFLADHSGDD